MSLDPASIDRIPLWSAVVPAAALALAAVLFAGGAGVGPVLLLPASLLMLGTIAALSLILPVVTRTTLGPVFAPTQLLAVGLVSIVLYAVFLYVQTTSHREYFAESVVAGGGNAVPGRRTAAFSLLLLLAGLVAVVLHAKLLSPMLEQAVAAMELPASLVGVVIAAIVLLPEALSALQAARANRLQAALNLVLGSALATIGLTIPIVGFLALYLDLPMVVGLSGTEMGLLLLALSTSAASAWRPGARRCCKAPCTWASSRSSWCWP